MILVIHPGALGDVLQAVPALTALRALPGGPPLTFAGQPRLGALLAGARVVDASLAFDGLGLEALFVGDTLPESLRSTLGAFDRVVSWFGSRADGFAARLRSIVPDALVAPPVPDAGPPPAVWEHLLATLAPWQVTRPRKIEPLALPDAWRREAMDVLARLGRDESRPLLVVHPGAGAEWKRWPAAAFARVIASAVAATGCQVLLHQGPADGDAVDRLARALDRPPLLLLEPPLPCLAAVLQLCGAYLGGDSGVSHLAAAVGAPAVILFPPATFGRWAPWSPTALALPMSDSSGDLQSVARALIESLGRAET